MPPKRKPSQQPNKNKTQANAASTETVSLNLPSISNIKQVQLLVVLILSVILYINTTGFDYVLDDAIVITNNQFTKQGTAGIKDILTKDTFFGFFGKAKQLVSGGRYRPLTLVTFALEVQFFGQNPHVSHFMNIVFYALTGLVLLFLLNLLIPPKDGKERLLSIPFIATLLFLAHPIHTEAVANIKGRDEVMCLLLSLTSLYWLVKYHYTQKVLYIVGSIVMFFLALLCKENAITFLAIIPLTFYFFTNASLKQNATYTGVIVAITAIFWVIRTKITGDYSKVEITEVLNNPFVYMTTMQKYATIMFTLGKYLLLLLIPHPLTHDYYYNQIPAMNWTDWQVLLALVANVGIGIWALLNIKKKTIPAFAILFYFITLSVVSNIVVPIGTFMSERFVYFSSLGFCLAAAYYIYTYLVEKTENTLLPKKATIVLVLILFGYTGKTIARNYAWETNIALFSTDIYNSPNSTKLLNSLGGELMAEADKEKDPVKKKQMLEESVTHLQKAVKIYPNYFIAWMLLGNAYFRAHKDYDNSIICYKNSLAINPEFQDAITNICLAYKAKEDWTNAIPAYKRALSIRPNDIAFLSYLAEAYRNTKHPDSALICYKNMLAIDPKINGVYRDIANTYAQNIGNMDSAIVYFNKAIDQDPKDASSMINMGIALGIKKQYDASITMLEKAIALTPNDPNIYRNIGIAYAQKGNKAQADVYMQKANMLMGGK